MSQQYKNSAFRIFLTMIIAMMIQINLQEKIDWAVRVIEQTTDFFLNRKIVFIVPVISGVVLWTTVNFFLILLFFCYGIGDMEPEINSIF